VPQGSADRPIRGGINMSLTGNVDPLREFLSLIFLSHPHASNLLPTAERDLARAVRFDK
jgi:hypothetical protein